MKKAKIILNQNEIKNFIKPHTASELAELV